jgi:hypothetical protein
MTPVPLKKQFAEKVLANPVEPIPESVIPQADPVTNSGTMTVILQQGIRYFGPSGRVDR